MYNLYLTLCDVGDFPGYIMLTISYILCADFLNSLYRFFCNVLWTFKSCSCLRTLNCLELFRSNFSEKVLPFYYFQFPDVTLALREAKQIMEVGAEAA